MRALAAATLLLPLLGTGAAAQTPAFRFLVEPPYGLPQQPAAPGPAPTPAIFALGERLFADPILSIDRTVSCQSCHPPATGFASPEPRPAGVQGRRARSHAPTLFNRGYGEAMRWDGGSRDLNTFVLEPIADPDEMGFSVAGAVERLRQDAHYGPAFEAAFADGATAPNLATALATFVRGIVRGDAPVDRFQRGQPDALTPEQRAGLWIFESKGGCWRCHPPPLFTDERFHNTGVGVVDGAPRPGRQAHTGDPADAGRFKTPTLRGIGLTAPYMHDGSLATLEDVVSFYGRGGHPNANLDPQLRPVALTAGEQASLAAFLRSL